MACNCKKKRDIEAKYGEPIEETWLDKAYKYAIRVLVFFILLCLSVILVPIIVVVAMYKLTFAKNPMITLPTFLGKLIK